MIDDPEIAALRQTIDELDHQVLELLARRVRVVLEVGDRKRREGIAVYDPEREQALLDRLVAHAPEPLDDATVRRVFERIVCESRRLEHEHMKSEPPPSMTTKR